METLSIKKVDSQIIAANNKANGKLIQFVNGSSTMPQGGVGDTISVRKLSEFGFTVEHDGVIGDMDSSTFEGLVELVDAYMEKPTTQLEVLAISQTSVATYDDKGTRKEETADAIKVETVVMTGEGSEVKNVKLNIIYRSKSAAMTFLNSFTTGDKGLLGIYASEINNRPTVWARVI